MSKKANYIYYLSLNLSRGPSITGYKDIAELKRTTDKSDPKYALLQEILNEFDESYKLELIRDNIQKQLSKYVQSSNIKMSDKYIELFEDHLEEKEIALSKAVGGFFLNDTNKIAKALTALKDANKSFHKNSLVVFEKKQKIYPKLWGQFEKYSRAVIKRYDPTQAQIIDFENMREAFQLVAIEIADIVLDIRFDKDGPRKELIGKTLVEIEKNKPVEEARDIYYATIIENTNDITELAKKNFIDLHSQMDLFCLPDKNLTYFKKHNEDATTALKQVVKGYSTPDTKMMKIGLINYKAANLTYHKNSMRLLNHNSPLIPIIAPYIALSAKPFIKKVKEVYPQLISS